MCPSQSGANAPALFTPCQSAALDLGWPQLQKDLTGGHRGDMVFLKKFILIYVFLAVLGLRCCVWAPSSCGEQGLLFVAVCGLLSVVASLVAEHGL